MKNLGASLDLRGTSEKIVFHTGFLKGQGVPLHRNRAGHLTLNVKDICKQDKASAHKDGQLHAASSFPGGSRYTRVSFLTKCPASRPSSCCGCASTTGCCEEVSPAFRAAAHLYKHAEERAAEREEAAGERERERGPEPQGAVPPPAQAVVPPVPGQEAALSVPQPPGDDEALPDRELNLDGMVPPPLVKLHKRLARRSELLKLHLKHYRMSSAQFRAPCQ